MAPAHAQPRALVYGHSFVPGFSEFIDTSQPRDIYNRDLHLAGIFEVYIFGVGGRTVVKAIRFDLGTISSTVPKRGNFRVGFQRCLRTR